MSHPEPGTFLSTLRVLFDKGVRCTTVIDAGSADGQFFLLLKEMGIVPDAVPFNIDANCIYEESLHAIRSVVGGDFAIAALTDHDGQIEFTSAVHPYWSSLRSRDDRYWAAINNLSATKSLVPAAKLDTLRKTFALQPPFLLKLDVQGAEHETLKGAGDLLRDTNIVVCEAMADDFREIDEVLVQHDFVLYDITHINRRADGTLGWFYPVYVNRALDNLHSQPLWDPAQNTATLHAQMQRRQSILKLNEQILARLQHARSDKWPPAGRVPAPVSRNDPCPCGSGKKYKHCCGAYVTPQSVPASTRR